MQAATGEVSPNLTKSPDKEMFRTMNHYMMLFMWRNDYVAVSSAGDDAVFTNVKAAGRLSST